MVSRRPVVPPRIVTDFAIKDTTAALAPAVRDKTRAHLEDTEVFWASLPQTAQGLAKRADLGRLVGILDLYVRVPATRATSAPLAPTLECKILVQKGASVLRAHRQPLPALRARMAPTFICRPLFAAVSVTRVSIVSQAPLAPSSRRAPAVATPCLLEA